MATFNWASLYSTEKLKSWNLPAYQREDPAQGIFRNLFLNWNALPTKDAQGNNFPLWQINCDVLQIDQEIVLDRPAFIFARRIELTNRASILINRMQGGLTSLIIFAQEIVDATTGESKSLKISAVDGDEKVSKTNFEVEKENSIQGISWPDNDPMPHLLDVRALDKGFYQYGEPLGLALTSIFQVAVLNTDEQLDLSLAQLRWVADLAAPGKNTQDLAGQAKSFETNLISSRSIQQENALLVPFLDLSVYESQAATYMELLEKRQEKWEKLESSKNDRELWLAAAEDSIAERQEDVDLAKKIEAQAKATRKQTLIARNIAAQQISAQRNQLEISRIQFDRGIADWKLNKEIDEAFNIVTGGAEILVQLPTIVAGGPGLINAAVGGLATGAELAISQLKDGLKTRSRASIEARELIEMQDLSVRSDSTDDDFVNVSYAKLDDLSVEDLEKKFEPILEEEEYENFKLAQAEAKEKSDQSAEEVKAAVAKAGAGAAKIGTAVKNILAIEQRARQLENSSIEALRMTNNSVDASFSSFHAAGLDLVTGGQQQWDNLLLEIDNVFEKIAEKAEIAGALAYRLELRRMVIFGSSLSQSRLAMAKANAQYAEMRLRRKSAEKALNIYKSRKDKLQDDIVNDELVQQLIFAKVLNEKRTVYLAMESYNRAFQYYTLSDPSLSPALPRLTDSVDKFKSAVSEITSRSFVASALGTPSPATIESLVIELTEEELLQRFKENGFISWNLSHTDESFNNFRRLRISNISIFADGLETSEKVLMQFSTSGVYIDKISEQNIRTFVSEPFSKNFLYNGTDQSVIVKGDVAERFREDFFSPTPFTTWTLKIKSQNGEALDRSTITGLRFVFQGEATSLN